MFNLSKWILVFVSILIFMYKSPFAPPFLPEPPSPFRRSFAPSFIPLGIVTVIFFLLEISPEPRHAEHFPPLTNLCPKHFGHVCVVNMDNSFASCNDFFWGNHNICCDVVPFLRFRVFFVFFMFF